MSEAPLLTTNELAAMGRDLSVPFRMALADGVLQCDTLLRVLPGKRVVCRASYKGKTVLAKIYVSRRAARHLNREVQGIGQLLEAGLAAPAVLGTEQLPDGNAQVLLLEYFANATDFSVRWRNAANPDERIALLHKAVALIAAMHAKGLQQGDIHLDNFLLHCAQGQEQMILIDGADIAPVKPADQQTQQQNLALFFSQFPPQNDSLIKEACQLYCQILDRPPNAMMADIMLWQTAAQRRTRCQKFVAKSFRESTRFLQKNNWRQRMVCQRDYYSCEFQTLLENLDQAIAGGEILKQGNSATVARVRIGALDLVIKRYNIRNPLHRLRRMFRPSRAAVSWANAQRLNHCGINTPGAIAMLEERIGPLRGRAYIINQYVRGMPATQFFATNAPQGKKSKSVIAQFDALFAAMANIRVSHGDFKATNFIVSGDQVMLIDLDHMRQHSRQKEFETAFNKDLARFWRNWNTLPKVTAAFKEADLMGSHKV